jgi:murein DD-endopeptidase MepM/ murein hydrolase activator NlpD
MKARVLSLVLLTVLAACARSGGPAPVEYRGVGSGETAPGAARTAEGYSAPEPVLGGGYMPPSSAGSVQAQDLPPPSGNSPINPSSVSSVPRSTEADDAYAQVARRDPVLSPLPQPVQSQPAAPAQQPVMAPTPAVPEPEINQGIGEFGWPLRGKILSNYGPKSGGRANDGINIAAPLGSPVYASKSGTVAYAGNELRGFGNMVLVRHDGGMFTVYAHLDSIKVAKEDSIGKGQVLGTVGKSGGVSEPQLHFEVRRGSNPLDPKKFLGK